MFYADSMVFLTPQGKDPIADPGLAGHLSLAHVTAAPPYLTAAAEILGVTAEFSLIISEQQGLKLVTRGRDLFADGKTRVVLGLQNAPDDASRENLQRLFANGIRIIAISYRSPEHTLGSGFDSMSKGLTETGCQFIRDCSELGLIVDLSHSGHETARDVLRLIDDENLPLEIMASHGGCYSIHKDPRNLPDDVLNGIAEHGGIVGIYSLTFGLHPSDNTPGPMLRHLRHAVDQCGVESVAIGSDAIYQAREFGEWREHIAWMIDTFDKDGRLGARWPETPVELNGLDRMQRLGRWMEKGYNEGQRERILAGNLLSFFRSALPSN